MLWGIIIGIGGCFAVLVALYVACILTWGFGSAP